MNACLHRMSLALALLAGAFGATGVAAQEEESKKRLEMRHTMTFETTPRAEQNCEARLSLIYFQKNTVAVVETTLENPDCGASSGEYTVLVRYRDENDELHTLEYPENWHRDNNQEITSVKEYRIGDNVDLVNVRSRKLRCVCAPPANVQGDTPE